MKLRFIRVTEDESYFAKAKPRSIVISRGEVGGNWCCEIAGPVGMYRYRGGWTKLADAEAFCERAVDVLDALEGVDHAGK